MHKNMVRFILLITVFTIGQSAYSSDDWSMIHQFVINKTQALGSPQAFYDWFKCFESEYPKQFKPYLCCINSLDPLSNHEIWQEEISKLEQELEKRGIALPDQKSQASNCSCRGKGIEWIKLLANKLAEGKYAKDEITIRDYFLEDSRIWTTTFTTINKKIKERCEFFRTALAQAKEALEELDLQKLPTSYQEFNQTLLSLKTRLEKVPFHIFLDDLRIQDQSDFVRAIGQFENGTEVYRNFLLLSDQEQSKLKEQRKIYIPSGLNKHIHIAGSLVLLRFFARHPNLAGQSFNEGWQCNIS